MYLVILDYLAPLDEVDRYVAEHRLWVDAGYRDGIFLASGPQNPRCGGAILAHGLERAALDQRLDQDPFKSHGVASYRVVDLTVTRSDPRLDFLQTN